MRLGVGIETRGLKSRLDLTHLGERLSDGETFGLFAEGISRSELRAAVRAHGIEALVMAGRDEKRLGAMAEDALHASGADRFAARVVNLHELCAYIHPRQEATEKAVLLLSAAMAAVRQYKWLRPANIRLRLGHDGGHLSRRDLLTLPSLAFEVIPAVVEDRCTAYRGCNLCEATCPAGAISIEDGIAHVQMQRCRNCGACLAACPVGAVDHPFYRRGVVDAALAALLANGEDGRPRIVAFACPGAMDTLRQAGQRRLTYPPSILPLKVPCAAFLDWYPVLGAIDRGASGAAVLACGAACRHGCSPDPVAHRFSALGRLLDACGLGKARLAVVAEDSADGLVAELNALAEKVSSLPRQVSVERPCDQDARAGRLPALLLSLCQRLGVSEELSLADEGLPFGQVRVDESRCSLCGLCADRCPTGALRYEESSQEANLLFRAADCTGCGLCTAACPEDCLRVERRLDLASLSGGARTLKADALSRCRQCGRPYAPRAMLRRVAAQLREPSLRLTGRCPDCRMVAGAAGQKR